MNRENQRNDGSTREEQKARKARETREEQEAFARENAYDIAKEQDKYLLKQLKKKARSFANEYLEQQKMTQKELAENIKVKENTLSVFLNDQNSVESSFLIPYKIAEHCDLSLDKLFGRCPESPHALFSMLATIIKMNMFEIAKNSEGQFTLVTQNEFVQDALSEIFNKEKSFDEMGFQFKEAPLDLILENEQFSRATKEKIYKYITYPGKYLTEQQYRRMADYTPNKINRLRECLTTEEELDDFIKTHTEDEEYFDL